MDCGNIALVSYIDGPLARFLDSLRIKLTPVCSPRAHVTILPPRQLEVSAHENLDVIRARVEEVCRGRAPFQAELGDVEIFMGSHVLYLDLSRGGNQLRSLHHELDVGMLAHDSGYTYHPHVTLAQGLEADDACNLLPYARGLWAAFPGPRCFDIEALTLVKEENFQSWSDVARIPIAEPVPGRLRPRSA